MGRRPKPTIIPKDNPTSQFLLFHHFALRNIYEREKLAAWGAYISTADCLRLDTRGKVFVIPRNSELENAIWTVIEEFHAKLVNNKAEYSWEGEGRVQASRWGEPRDV